jgi:hypothetical protein
MKHATGGRELQTFSDTECPYLFLPAAVALWRLRRGWHSRSQLAYKFAAFAEVRDIKPHHNVVAVRLCGEGSRPTVHMRVSEVLVPGRRDSEPVFQAVLALQRNRKHQSSLRSTGPLVK